MSRHGRTYAYILVIVASRLTLTVSNRGFAITFANKNIIFIFFYFSLCNFSKVAFVLLFPKVAFLKVTFLKVAVAQLSAIDNLHQLAKDRDGCIEFLLH